MAANRAVAAGDFRRRVDVIEQLVFVIDTDDFPAVVARMQRYGGRTPLLSSGKHHAVFSLSSGVLLRLQLAGEDDWGFHMVVCTGSKDHLKKLTAATAPLSALRSGTFKSEAALYRKYGLRYIEPELRHFLDHGMDLELVSASAIMFSFSALDSVRFEFWSNMCVTARPPPGRILF